MNKTPCILNKLAEVVSLMTCIQELPNVTDPLVWYNSPVQGYYSAVTSLVYLNLVLVIRLLQFLSHR